MFPIAFLRSFAYAGVAWVLAGLFSVVVLPAILFLLGHRVNALTLWRRSVTPPEEGFWHRVATVVMRRPVPIATAVVAFLLVLGTPFLGLRLSSPDDRVLPESADVRQVHDVLREEFSSKAEALSVVAPDAPNAVPACGTRSTPTPPSWPRCRASPASAAPPPVPAAPASPSSWAASRASSPLPDSSPRYADFTADGATYLSVIPSVEPVSEAGEDLVHAIR